MGIFKTIGKGLKGVAKFAGGAAKKLAPALGLIPGVGTVAGAAIGGLGSVASDFGNSRKISLGNALKSGVAGGLSGLAGAKLLGGKGLPGLLSKAGGLIKGGGAPPVGVNTGKENMQAMLDAGVPYDEALKAVGQAGQTTQMGGLPSIGGDLAGGGAPGGGLLNTIKNFALKNPGKIAGMGLGIANTISAGKQSGEADAQRKIALSRLQNRAPIDLGDTFQDPSNPYAQQVPGTARKTALRSLQGVY